jgi:hypothetical protein
MTSCKATTGSLAGATVGGIGVGLDGKSVGGIGVELEDTSVGGIGVAVNGISVAVGGFSVGLGAAGVFVGATAGCIKAASSDPPPWLHAVKRQTMTTTMIGNFLHMPRQMRDTLRPLFPKFA